MRHKTNADRPRRGPGEERELSMKNRKFSGTLKVAIMVAALIVIAALVCFVAPIVVSNTAITMEEQINEFHSNLGAQYQRRYDLYNTLSEAVNAARNADELQVQIAEARTAAEGGNVSQANMMIQAVAEAYPELRSHDAYLAFMAEAPLTENMIARYRESFNNAVRSYRAYVRRIPNRTFLGWAGHETVDFQFLEFEQQGQGPPTGLFQ